MICLLTLAFLWVAGGTAGTPATPLPPQFVAIARRGDRVFLLDSAAPAIYVQRGTAPPVLGVRLTDAAGHRVVTTHSPSGLAIFGGEWLLADGSRRLYGFGADGRATRNIEIPVPAFDVFACGNRLYVYDALPDTTPVRFWYTTDLKTFRPVNLSVVENDAPERTRMLAAQLAIAATDDGGFWFIHAVGEPTATRFRPGGPTTAIELAYSRTRSRARLVTATSESDIERYSAPARHAIFDGGALYVLRNREDIDTGSGHVMQQGRRVDRYDEAGRLAATAELPATARWILRADSLRVVVATAEGRILTASFGRPQAGRLLAD